MPSDMGETGLETLIVNWLTKKNQFEEGANSDYTKEYALDEVRLFIFLCDTQNEKIKELRILDPDKTEVFVLDFVNDASDINQELII